jgi:hypothetical protein
VKVDCASKVPSVPKVTAKDNCSVKPVQYNQVKQPGSTCANRFTLTRTWSVQDGCGLTDQFTQTIRVWDNQPPHVEPLGDLCLWPPNHWYYCFQGITAPVGTQNPWFQSGTDNCGGPITLSFVSCTSSQCDNGKCTPIPDNGDGNTINDCVFQASQNRLCLRAERAATTGTRYYSVALLASDECGNTSEVNFSVFVPKDQSDHPDCLRGQFRTI